MRSRDVAARALSTEQMHGRLDDGPAQAAKLKGSALDTRDQMNQTQPLMLHRSALGVEDPLKKYSMQLQERRDEGPRKSMDSAQIEMSEGQLRPVGHHFQQ